MLEKNLTKKNPYFLIPKVWLNHFLDDHELNNIKKLEKKRKKRKRKEEI